MLTLHNHFLQEPSRLWAKDSCKWPGAKFLGLVKYSCHCKIDNCRLSESEIHNTSIFNTFLYLYIMYNAIIYTNNYEDKDSQKLTQQSKSPLLIPAQPKSWQASGPTEAEFQSLKSLWLLWHALAEKHVTNSTVTVRFIVAKFWCALWTVWWTYHKWKSLTLSDTQFICQ